MTAAEIQSIIQDLGQTAPRARPGCAERIRFRAGSRGRRPRYCSGACRAKFSRERTHLHRTWARLRRSAGLSEPPLPSKEIERVIDHVEWLLEGYGGFDKFLAHSLLAPRPGVPLEATFTYLDLITDDELESLGRFVDRVTSYRNGEAVFVNPDDPLAP